MARRQVERREEGERRKVRTRCETGEKNKGGSGKMRERKRCGDIWTRHKEMKRSI